MRVFSTGATRGSLGEKLQYSGFLSPHALRRFALYMQQHQVQADGVLRAPDNWKKGMPIPSYVDSMARHVVDFLAAYEEGDLELAEELACAIWFNVQGFLYERVKP